jgi:hypothetical protein
LDRSYDSGKTRDLPDVLGFHGEIAGKGGPPAGSADNQLPVALS